jgi:hypothetical protein
MSAVLSAVPDTGLASLISVRNPLNAQARSPAGDQGRLRRSGAANDARSRTAGGRSPPGSVLHEVAKKATTPSSDEAQDRASADATSARLGRQGKEMPVWARDHAEDGFTRRIGRDKGAFRRS